MAALPNFQKVAVVGRGESAYLLENHPDFSLTILVNFSDSDLADEKFRRRVIASRSIVLLHNSMEISVSPKTASEMNLSAVVWIGFRPSAGNNRRRTTWRLNRLGRNVQYMPRDPAGRTSVSGGGAGITGVALASMMSNDVHTFGIDFHKTDYIPGSMGKVAADAKGPTLQSTVGPKRERALLELASLNQDVSFTLHSTINLQVTAPNVASVVELRGRREKFEPVSQ